MDPEKSVDSSSCSKSITVLENSSDSTLVKGQTSDSVSSKPQITHENDARTTCISFSSQVNEEEVMDNVNDTTTHEASKANANRFHVINLSGVEEEERVCRICHFDYNQSLVSRELIEIGCKCKNGLHLAHENCAQVWFKLKGNSVCEICGDRAKNVRVGERREERERGSDDGGGSSCFFFFFLLLIFLPLHWFYKKIDAIKTSLPKI